MGISLGANQYGKAENRVVRIYRDTDRHEIVDLNVSTSLRGEFAPRTPTATRPTYCPPTPRRTPRSPTPSRTASTSPEDYAIALGKHFLDAAPKATDAQIKVEQYAWDRIQVGGAGHDHAFVRRGGAVRTTVVTVSGRGRSRRCGSSPASATSSC